MIIRILKYKLKSKEFKILCFISLVIYLCLFLCIKNEFFYAATQYSKDYLKYYIDNYLTGIATDLIFENDIMFYIESGVKNIYSSLYIYLITFNNNIYLIFVILIIIYIFHYISSILYCDIYNKSSLFQIYRIGMKKYVNKTILTNSLYCGIIFMLPKLIYFTLLSIFFPMGISYIHFLGNTSFISEKFLYIGYNCSPYILICLDFLISFLYGMVISLISFFVVLLVKNKALSYLILIFFISFVSVIQYILNQVPIIFYNSIFTYADVLNIASMEINVCKPIIEIIIMLILMFLIIKYLIKKRIERYR